VGFYEAKCEFYNPDSFLRFSEGHLKYTILVSKLDFKTFVVRFSAIFRSGNMKQKQ